MDTETSPPTMELWHNLPALVTQLKALRQDMARQSKLYDSLLSAADTLQPRSTRPIPPTGPLSSTSTQSGMRGSIFTPFSNAQLDPRASQLSFEDLSALETGRDEPHDAKTSGGSRHFSVTRRQQPQGSRQATRHLQPRASHSMSNGVTGPRIPDKYTVMWVSGECGISLRNFSRNDNKVGAQIAVLQHADGVTTGISKCRLGDQLVTINDERVDALRFREIVEKLKTTRRPISLGFHPNANMQTSPRSVSSPSSNNFRNSTGGSRANHFFARGGSIEATKMKETSPLSAADRHSVSGDSYTDANQPFDDDESSDLVHQTMEHPGNGDWTSHSRSSSSDVATWDRSTITSVQSSSSTLSDDLELWCREHEEMHSVIIVLLTETVMRCEKLQQENHDQLQNLMQLSANNPHSSDRSSTVSFHAGAEKVINVENQLDVLGVNAIVQQAVASHMA